MAKKFMTKEEKQSLVDSYQKKIDEHFLSIVDKVADYFIEESDKNIPIWESDVFENSFYNPESGTQYNFENTLLLDDSAFSGFTYQALKNKIPNVEKEVVIFSKEIGELYE